MTASKPRMIFWASKEVSRVISRAMTEKNPGWKRTPGVPPIKDLRRQIMNSPHGRYIVSPPLVPPYGYCIDQLPFEKDDSVASYTRFRFYLAIVADLLSLFRQKVDKAHSDAWQRASVIFEENAERRTLFQFLREVSAADRPQAMNCLEAISKRGVAVEWPGKIASCYWASDCGLKAMVGITEEMLDFLTHDKGTGGKSVKRPSDATPRIKKRAQIWLDTYSTKDADLVCLKTRGQEPIPLARKEGELIKMLKRDGLGASDEKICKKFWPDSVRGNWELGAFGSLKNLVGAVNSKLKKRWGNPPDQKRWIDRIDKGTYFLNGSVRWDYLTEKDFKKNYSRPMDPNELADTVLDHRNDEEEGDEQEDEDGEHEE